MPATKGGTVRRRSSGSFLSFPRKRESSSFLSQFILSILPDSFKCRIGVAGSPTLLSLPFAPVGEARRSRKLCGGLHASRSKTLVPECDCFDTASSALLPCLPPSRQESLVRPAAGLTSDGELCTFSCVPPAPLRASNPDNRLRSVVVGIYTQASSSLRFSPSGPKKTAPRDLRYAQLGGRMGRFSYWPRMGALCGKTAICELSYKSLR